MADGTGDVNESDDADAADENGDNNDEDDRDFDDDGDHEAGGDAEDDGWHYFQANSSAEAGNFRVQLEMLSLCCGKTSECLIVPLCVSLPLPHQKTAVLSGDPLSRPSCSATTAKGYLIR